MEVDGDKRWWRWDISAVAEARGERAWDLGVKEPGDLFRLSCTCKEVKEF